MNPLDRSDPLDSSDRSMSPSERAAWERIAQLHSNLRSYTEDLEAALRMRSQPRLSCAAQGLSNTNTELLRYLGRIDEIRGDL